MIIFILLETMSEIRLSNLDEFLIVSLDKIQDLAFGQILLINSEIYRKMSMAINPYGDGTASLKIFEECKKFLLN